MSISNPHQILDAQFTGLLYQQTTAWGLRATETEHSPFCRLKMKVPAVLISDEIPEALCFFSFSFFVPPFLKGE